MISAYIVAKQHASWRLGAQHREDLVRVHMARNGLRERPMLKDVIDDLLTEVQGVRLLEEVLPLDTFAQTEVLGSRIVVSVNQRIGEMPGVKDPEGVAYLARWHESIHVAEDVRPSRSTGSQMSMALAGLAREAPRLIVCRKIGMDDEPAALGREFVAENAALAAAISPADLERSPAYFAFRDLVAQGGDVTIPGWSLLAGVAKEIGVNRAALFKYWHQRGTLVVIQEAGSQRLIATAPLSFGAAR